MHKIVNFCRDLHEEGEFFRGLKRGTSLIDSMRKADGRDD
jgi:hypothetical protein